MAFGTVSDPLLAVALWTACGALAMTAALLAAIVVMRLRLLRHLAAERRVAAQWNPLLAECAERVPERLPRLCAREAETFLVLWCRAQESLRGEVQERLRELARRAGASAHAERLLRSGSLRGELLALVALGHLREPAVVPLVQRLVAATAPVTSLIAAQALLRIDPELGIPQLLAATTRRDDWPLAGIVSILRECDPQRVGSLLSIAIRAELDRADGTNGVARLLRLHVAAHGELLRGAVLEVLARTQDPAPLAAGLSALWHPEDAEHARRLLAHSEWMVRVAAARALGRFGGSQDYERLAAALGDASWWVRYRAAQALCALPGIAADEISRLPGRLTDRFAADMLRQVLADRRPA